MSILQEYEEIKKGLRDGEFDAIERYLSIHPELYLSDIYYKEHVYKQFDAWWTEEKTRKVVK